jgi:hypothetical protein
LDVTDCDIQLKESNLEVTNCDFKILQETAMGKIIRITDDILLDRIYFIREQKVMLDRDLAELYGVETKVLNQAVSRNIKRFPEDFMFQLTMKEFENLKSQIVTSSWGGIRKLPFVFTEQGVAMLSSVLNSKRAIQVNIQIMRLYTRMRSLLLNHKDLLLKIEKIESKISSHDEHIKILFDYLKNLLQEEDKPRKQVGFKIKK